MSCITEHLRQDKYFNDNRHFRLCGRQSNLLIFEVENEIFDSLSKLDNVVLYLERDRERERCFENKQFSLSGQISNHVYYTGIRSKVLNKIFIMLHYIHNYINIQFTKIPLIRAELVGVM